MPTLGSERPRSAENITLGELDKIREMDKRKINEVESLNAKLKNHISDLEERMKRLTYDKEMKE